jgi:transposase
MRGLAVGRKNHYGSRSLADTKVAALFYSLVETCRRLGIEPETYLVAAATAGLERDGAVLTPSMFAAAARAQAP